MYLSPQGFKTGETSQCLELFGLFVYAREQRFIKDLLSVILGIIRPSLVIWSLFPLSSSVSHSSPRKLFTIHGLSGLVSLATWNMVDKANKDMHIQGCMSMCGVNGGSESLLIPVSVTEARLSPSKATTSWQQLEITFLNVWWLYTTVTKENGTETVQTEVSRSSIKRVLSCLGCLTNVKGARASPTWSPDSVNGKGC